MVFQTLAIQLHFQMKYYVAGEIVQWFRACTVLAKDWIWFLAVTSGSWLCITPALGDLKTSSGLCRQDIHDDGSYIIISY